MPLSITTVPEVEGKQRPYEDSVGYDGLIHYWYRGTDPNHHENVGLRLAMKRQTPLVYFFGVVPGQYLATWPAFVVGDDRNFLGIRPDYSVEIREDLLVEHDGPMLEHGLREFYGRELLALPRSEAARPNRESWRSGTSCFERRGREAPEISTWAA